MKIRKTEINTGRPAVCVPVTDSDPDRLTEHIAEITGEADIIEWRMDYFSNLFPGDYLSDLMKRIRKAAADTPLLFTLRTEREGGFFPFDAVRYTDVLLLCARSGFCDMIDVEYSSVSGSAGIFNELRSTGTVVVASHHDFKSTPTESTMTSLLQDMAAAGADMVKLAVMPETSSDVLELLRATYSFHRAEPDIPLITMSMGRLGVISRISGGTFGSCITFGSDRKASAPGQVDFRELKQMLRILDEAGV